MDIPTQDAVERLMRNGDFQKVLDYISGRRLSYMEFLLNYQPQDVGGIARAQGQAMAFQEVINIPATAQDHKNARTNNG